MSDTLRITPLGLVEKLPYAQQREIYKYLAVRMRYPVALPNTKNIERYKAAVEQACGVSLADRRKNRINVIARVIMCYQLHLDNWRSSDIALIVGLDRATVSYSIQKMKDIIANPTTQELTLGLWKCFNEILDNYESKD